MGFDDSEDDCWQFPDHNDPPCSPIKPYVHPSSYGPVVNEADRQREAKLLTSIDTEQTKTLQRRASNELALNFRAVDSQPYPYGGSSLSTSALPLDVAPSTPLVVTTLSVLAPLISTPPRRGLARQHSALTDKDVAELPYVPTRRRLNTKTSDLGPEWPTAPSLPTYMHGAAATNDHEYSSVTPCL